MKYFNRAATTAAFVLTAALALSGCGSDSMPGMDHGSQPSGTPTTAATNTAPTGQNDQDVAFATGMIPHHRQAIEMADMAMTKAQNPTVKQLAAAIKAAQDPEIQQLSGWLTGWGKPVPTPGMGHGMHADGMMTEQEMTDLEKASGATFDRMWVQMMIKHHQGAVIMAKTEQTSGQSTQAITLAKKIEADQTREIATMQQLLTQLR